VFYRGKGTITPNTTSTLISLPAYVPALANHFTVQITPIYNGQMPSVYAASNILHGTFEVHGPLAPSIGMFMAPEEPLM
jgi:hypothetical protein